VLPHLKIYPNAKRRISCLTGRFARKMRLTMEQKRAISAKVAARYRAQRGRKARARVLDEVVELTEYNRHYAAWVLRRFGTARLVRGATGTLVKLVVGRRNKRRATLRPRKYDEAVKRVLL
jgi:hypothetical protein